MKLLSFLGACGGALYCSICCNLLPAVAQTRGLAAAVPPTAIAQAGEQDISPGLRAKIERLIEVSGSKDSIRAITPGFLQQLLASQQLPPRAAEIVAEEFATFFLSDENLNSLIDAQVPLYVRYYTEADIDELIAFYESPVGQKFAALSPAFARDSIQVSQSWANERLPQFIERLRARLEAENLQP